MAYYMTYLWILSHMSTNSDGLPYSTSGAKSMEYSTSGRSTSLSLSPQPHTSSSVSQMSSWVVAASPAVVSCSNIDSKSFKSLWSVGESGDSLLMSIICHKHIKYDPPNPS